MNEPVASAQPKLSQLEQLFDDGVMPVFEPLCYDRDLGFEPSAELNGASSVIVGEREKVAAFWMSLPVGRVNLI